MPKASAAQKAKQLSFTDKLESKRPKKDKAPAKSAKAEGAKRRRAAAGETAELPLVAPKEGHTVGPELTAPLEPITPALKPEKPARQRVTAERMGEQQREISISEFFTKNRHLLGFDNASRALLTSVKEAVDNSLDACEEAGILPDLKIEVAQISESRYRMLVEDNGPGIVKAQIPKVFGKLLYGSKFHRLRQSRGQQGIGISAAGMYGQLTTGKPVHVVSKTGKGRPAFACDLAIDAKANKPTVFHESEDQSPRWLEKDHGTLVAIEMEATYKGGKRSLDEWVQQVAFANPHARIEYLPPGKGPVVYPRVTPELPPETKEIKPHPHGVELGMLMRLMQGSPARTVSSFLQAEFSRVSTAVAAEICKNAGLSPDVSLKHVRQPEAEKLYNGIAATKIMAPPTNCLAPIGEPALIEGLKALLVQQHFASEEAKKKKAEEAAQARQDAQALQAAEQKVTAALAGITVSAEVDEEEEEEAGEREVDTEKANKIEKKLAEAKKAEEAHEVPADEALDEAAPVKAGVIDVFGHPCFVTAVTRSPRVYRGNPFQVEAALAYGGEIPADDVATVIRFANRVPLLYQQGACAMTQSVVRTSWRNYDVEQARGALPAGPLLIMVHIASVWVPFTSEAKEAVAHYDEIIAELKFALQECGRRLSRHIRRRRREADAEKKAKYIERYIPHIGQALRDILGLTEPRTDEVVDKLTGILERSRKM